MAEGRHVVDKMFGKSSEMLSYENLSTIMFLDPLVSGVGYGERILQQVWCINNRDSIRDEELGEDRVQSCLV